MDKYLKKNASKVLMMKLQLSMRGLTRKGDVIKVCRDKKFSINAGTGNSLEQNDILLAY